MQAFTDFIGFFVKRRHGPHKPIGPTQPFEITRRADWSGLHPVIEVQICADETTDRGDLLGRAVRAAYRAGHLLAGCDLRGADLSGLNLFQADLTAALLGGADLSLANLEEADLTMSNLRDADLSGARLARANLEGADLRGAYLAGADLTGAVLEAADLREADLTDVRGYSARR